MVAILRFFYVAGGAQAYNLISQGDSITFGYTLPDTTHAYPARTATAMGTRYGSAINLGLTGYRVDELTSVWNNTGHTNLSQTMPNIVTCLAGINNVRDNTDATTIIAYIQAWHDAVRTSLNANSGGHPNYILWGTMTSVATDSSSAQKQVRLDVNSYLRANWASMGFDGLFDAGADADVGVMPINSSYFTDDLHPNDAGQVRIASNCLVPELHRLGLI